MDTAQIPLRGLVGAAASGRRLPRGWPAAILILLAAAYLRALPWLDHRFHPDEALYAFFARLIASGRDLLLSSVLVDKPPLPFYLTGLSLSLWGGSEFAARLPNLFASLIGIALVLALGRRLYDTPTALLAAAILALSPFAVLFSITVFTDPLLTTLVLWSLLAGAAHRPRWAGAAFALAFAVKQTALLFLPLLLGLSLLALPPRARVCDAARHLAVRAAPVLAGLLISAAVIFGWDWARQVPIGFWAQGYGDNIPGRFIRSGEVLPRARAWLDLLRYFTASRPINWLFLAGLPALLAGSQAGPSRAALADRLLAGYCLLYLAGYWLLAFNVWDRYLLPLVPLAALLLARVLRFIGYAYGVAAYRWSRRFGGWAVGLGSRTYRLLPFALCLLLIPPALTAARSQYPIGGDHGAYDGIDDAARFLRRLPEGQVLYDHWLSWQWNFYLFDGPLYVAWFPTPEALAIDLAAFGRSSERYLVVPHWESEAEVAAAARGVGFETVHLYTAVRRDGSPAFEIFQFIPRPPDSQGPGLSWQINRRRARP